MGFSASLWPLLPTKVASVGKKVPSVALRLNSARPSWKSMVGVQEPKSAPAREEEEAAAVELEARGMRMKAAEERVRKVVRMSVVEYIFGDWVCVRTGSRRMNVVNLE